MLFILLFEDDPTKLAVRQAEMTAHRAFLDRNRERILVAGSLRDQPDANPSGGLWIVDAADRAACDAIYKEDPFWTKGLRHSVTIKLWSKAFPDRKTPV